MVRLKADFSANPIKAISADAEVARFLRVTTIGDEERLVNYAKSIVNELPTNFVRVEADCSANKINGKIQDAEKAKLHTMLVNRPARHGVGERERAPAQQRPAGREAEGRSDGGNTGGD